MPAQCSEYVTRCHGATSVVVVTRPKFAIFANFLVKLSQEIGKNYKKAPKNKKRPPKFFFLRESLPNPKYGKEKDRSTKKGSEKSRGLQKCLRTQQRSEKVSVNPKNQEIDLVRWGLIYLPCAKNPSGILTEKTLEEPLTLVSLCWLLLEKAPLLGDQGL